MNHFDMQVGPGSFYQKWAIFPGRLAHRRWGSEGNAAMRSQQSEGCLCLHAAGGREGGGLKCGRCVFSRTVPGYGVGWGGVGGRGERGTHGSGHNDMMANSLAATRCLVKDPGGRGEGGEAVLQVPEPGVSEGIEGRGGPGHRDRVWEGGEAGS